jgi:hypothetical protein
MIRPEEFEKLVNNIYYTGYEKEVERAFSVIESELASELHKHGIMLLLFVTAEH